MLMEVRLFTFGADINADLRTLKDAAISNLSHCCSLMSAWRKVIDFVCEKDSNNKVLLKLTLKLTHVTVG